MSWQIRPADRSDAQAVQAFNDRLKAGGIDFQLPDSPESLGVARDYGAPVWHEIFIAVDGDAVRGGYALKRELLYVGGAALGEIWNYQIPLSEGIIDRTYATLGIRLLQDASRRASYMYCLGMGSMERPLPRLLQRFGWQVEPVPFFFRVLRANGFLANIEFLRAKPTVRLACDVMRVTGIGAVAVAAHKLSSAITAPRSPVNLIASEVTQFGPDADSVFEAVRQDYGSLIDRTASALNVRFPGADKRLVRLVFRDADRVVGWLVVSRSQCTGHRQFGNMRLGAIVDGLCRPDLVPTLVRMGVDRLRHEGVDLIVSNQSHNAWRQALLRNGFFSGPSNFILARSPALAEKSPELGDTYVNRGDGDGPINL